MIMKTKYLSRIFFILVPLALLTSCEGFLEEFPRLSQSNELTLSTYEGLNNATSGTYSKLCGPTWYGEDFVIVADLKGGNAKIGPVSSGRYFNEYFWINTEATTLMLWDDGYATIARANNIISKIDGGFSQAGITEEQLDQLKGENLFLRALAYWDLVRFYAQPYSAGTSNLGVPVVLVTENKYPARNTVGEVYEQVVADLQDAIDLLSEENPRGNDGGFATSWSAKALLAKVYLYMEEWALATQYATDVINNGPFDMFDASDYTTWSQGGYWGSGGAGAEIIFQVDGSVGNSDHGYWDAISYEVDPEGYGDIATSNDLLSLYEAGDVRADLFQEPAAYPGDFWTLKYPGRLGKVPRREFNVPVLRLSEMYLIRAEACLNGAAPNTALADYNMIRTHRGLAAAGSVSLQNIYEERRRELCFEGNELFDLSRTGRSLDRTDYDGASNEDIPFVVGGTAAQNYLWALPIPSGEIDANNNMEQNPGY
jgi:hypothetical protein